MKRLRRLALRAVLATLVVALGASVVANAGGLEIRSDDPPFRASVPDGFHALESRGTAPRAFVRPLSGGDSIVITLQAMDGALARTIPTERDAHDLLRAVQPTAEVRVDRARCMDLDVPLLVARSASGDTVIVAGIPTVPRGVRLVVSAPDGASDAALAATRALMASFQGRSNWLTDTQITRRLAARTTIIVAWVMLGLYALAWAFKRRPGLRLEIAWLAAIAAAFGTTAILLAGVPRGATAFEPWTPAIVAAVVLANLARVMIGALQRRG